jgi:hypothetical protein
MQVVALVITFGLCLRVNGGGIFVVLVQHILTKHIAVDPMVMNALSNAVIVMLPKHLFAMVLRFSYPKSLVSSMR